MANSNTSDTGCQTVAYLGGSTAHHHHSYSSHHHHHHHQYDCGNGYGGYPLYADNATNPDDEHRPILAERFKTKMCRNYEMTGVCPYVHRCMFAHGDHELRTKHMNLVDGLTTEEAIKNFKRYNYETQKMRQSYCYYGPMGTSAYAPSEADSRSSTPTPPPSPPGSASGAMSYRHDPYAQHSHWHPLTQNHAGYFCSRSPTTSAASAGTTY